MFKLMSDEEWERFRADQSWKGEHLIRGSQSTARTAEPKPWEHRRRRADRFRECLYPGCGKKLYHGATAGVCIEHMHQIEFCQCVRCERLREKGDDGNRNQERRIKEARARRRKKRRTSGKD